MIKSKDLPALVLMVGLAAIISYFGSNLLFGSSSNRSTKVEVVDPITSEFNYQDKPYYAQNENPALAPLNPTRDITINANNNPTTLGQ